MATAVARRVMALCHECAHSIHGGTISDHYALSVARLLFMTLAHESDSFRARRQYKFKPTTSGGAFGLAQTERTSMWLSIKRMKRDDAVGRACRAFLTDHAITFPHKFKAAAMQVQVPAGDPLSVLLCRLHYLRVPAPVPGTITEMAAYAKKYYNTAAGKAKPTDYENAYYRLLPTD